ncbi:MAG: hypothetical protein ACR2PI_11030 [Hyphomicrobiaceae bacterium]
MTPTLLGRWQTRFLLYAIIAIPVTLAFSYALIGRLWPPSLPPFVFVTAIMVVGFVLDIAYVQIQRFRWDNDWPFAFQFFFSILEFLIAYGLMSLGWFDHLTSGVRIEFTTAALHFTLVFVPSFLALLGGIQIFLTDWRFKGGEIGGFE